MEYGWYSGNSELMLVCCPCCLLQEVVKRQEFSVRGSHNCFLIVVLALEKYLLTQARIATIMGSFILSAQAFLGIGVRHEQQAQRYPEVVSYEIRKG